MVLLGLIGLTFMLGPAVGASYALANGVPAIDTAVYISLLHLALVPVWFAIIHFARYEFRRHDAFMRRMAGEKMTKKIEKRIEDGLEQFRAKLSRWSLGTAVFGLTFLFGVSWAAMIAILLKIESLAIMPAIAAGAVASSVFWTVALAGTLGFLPDERMLYIVFGIITFALLTHGKMYERKMLGEVSGSLKEIGIDMETMPYFERERKRKAKKRRQPT